MSERKFKFSSPGIFVKEIDNSQVPAAPQEVGPIIIGRTEKGPAMRPVTVDSFSDFIETFGYPIPGNGKSDSRTGNYAAPTYGAYAAQAWLDAGVSPVTFIRLLGEQNYNYTANSGEAGWASYDYRTGTKVLQTAASASSDVASAGGAYGLFVFPSSSSGIHGTGTLAAVWYMVSGAIMLSGSDINGGTTGSPLSGTSVVLHSIAGTGEDATFCGIITNKLAASNQYLQPLYRTTFNFNKDSDKFIRKVFNTSPILTNTNITDTSSLRQAEDRYWLGETYERAVSDLGQNSLLGVILSMKSGSGGSYGDMRGSYQDAQTSWFFGQDLTSEPANYFADNMTRLFKLHGRDHGEWLHKNIKASITNIRASTNNYNPYGTFTVQIRLASDNDNSMNIIEQFTDCSLDPSSPDYVARKIGDRYVRWDSVTSVLKEYGTYDNQSKYVRIEMNPAVEQGLTDARLVPWGVWGPIRPKGFNLYGTGSHKGMYDPENPFTAITTYATGGLSTFATRATSSNSAVVLGGGITTNFTASVRFPRLMTRTSASDGLTDGKKAYWGVHNKRSAGEVFLADDGYGDYLRLLPFGGSQYDSITGAPAGFEYSFVTTLDDVVVSNSTTAFYQSGSRALGTSLTALSGNVSSLINLGYAKFSAPFYGGHDGLNVQKSEPFDNTMSTDVKTDYALNSIVRAINTCADPEAVEGNLISVPGVYVSSVNGPLASIAEARGDMLAVLDIPNVYTPQAESTSTFANRIGTVDNAIASVKSLGVNTSYACTYYPWVQIKDVNKNALVWVPPSIAAIGTFASSDARSQVWFAPAGFNRGGLSGGSAGLPVLNVTQKLTSDERDKLYEANINPIASFPSEGIVIFGQKTLQVTPSALDRINVRRMMIFVKRAISKQAADILFDQNVRTTWLRFKNRAEPFLNSIKANLGLEDFKIVLDETTTTPDLVDRNIMYAKIYLKPAKAIEYIALDFTVTRSGINFS